MTATNGRRPSAASAKRVKPILITGGAGFIGCNLADRLAREGEHVLVLDSLARAGTEENITWLQRRHPRRVSWLSADIRERDAADAVTQASAVIHLAAQVAVTTSIEEPLADLDVNLRGTALLLEAARRSASLPPFLFASTNKVYGGLGDVDLETTETAVRPRAVAVRRYGISEDRPLDFHTPYGCSKGAADQYVLDYARTYAIPAAVLRMSCIYGPHQHGTEDQGWVAHFLIRALDRQPITVFGDGRQVRDILHVDDAVEAYARALRGISSISGRAFNLGGGPENAVSLLQLLSHIGELQIRRPLVSFADARPSDQRWYVSDPRRIREALGLPSPRPWREGISQLASWLMSARGTHREIPHAAAPGPLS